MSNGTHSQNPGELPPGTLVSDRYRVERLIGQGAMGAVYLATHVHMRKRVALKLLLPDVSDSAEVLERFEREAMAAAHIEHPNVVAATDFGRTADGGFFLVLEYVEGESLRKHIEGGPMPARRAVRIARQIASALGRAHAMGIVHRDLKPDNVMLVRREGDDELVKVLDFGIAKVPVNKLAASGTRTTKHALTQIGSVFGTPEYMAPEQAMGESVDSRADLYALGITLYEMLAGVRPFESDSAVVLLTKHVTASPPPISVLAPNVSVPPELEALVMRLLAKKPADRPANAEEVEAALAATAALVPAPPSSPTATGPAHGTWSKADAVARTVLPVREERDAERAGHAVPVAPVLVRMGAALALLAILGIAVAVLWPTAKKGKAETAADAGPSESSWSLFPAKLSDDRLKTAAQGGPDTLIALAREFPDDGRIPRELVRVHLARGAIAAALEVLGKLAATDPKSVDDADAGRVIDAALAGDAASFDATLRLAEGPLGPRIVDELIDLSSKAGPAKAKAQKALARPEIRTRASPAADITLDLRDAKTCETRRTILPRAKDGGDARTLAVVETFRRTRGCGVAGFFDCYLCLRRDRLLEETIDAMEARLPPKPSPAAPSR